MSGWAFALGSASHRQMLNARVADDFHTKFELRLRLVLIKCSMSGSHLLSHTVSSIVSSAAWGLTIVFGMGTGVSPRRIATGTLFFQLSSCYGLQAASFFHTLPLDNSTVKQPLLLFPRKEVIQPHLPIRLPCYDFTPVIRPAFGSSLR